jgi:hypothetical protein
MIADLEEIKTLFYLQNSNDSHPLEFQITPNILSKNFGSTTVKTNFILSQGQHFCNLHFANILIIKGNLTFRFSFHTQLSDKSHQLDTSRVHTSTKFSLAWTKTMSSEI